jgi:hypothetical protein
VSYIYRSGVTCEFLRGEPGHPIFCASVPRWGGIAFVLIHLREVLLPPGLSRRLPTGKLWFASLEATARSCCRTRFCALGANAPEKAVHSSESFALRLVPFCCTRTTPIAKLPFQGKAVVFEKFAPKLNPRRMQTLVAGRC